MKLTLRLLRPHGRTMSLSACVELGMGIMPLIIPNEVKKCELFIIYLLKIRCFWEVGQFF